VRVVEHCRVANILATGDRVTGVTTERGEIRSEIVVNCGGMWARDIAGWFEPVAKPRGECLGWSRPAFSFSSTVQRASRPLPREIIEAMLKDLRAVVETVKGGGGTQGDCSTPW
jgi:hypothetical protein